MQAPTLLAQLRSQPFAEVAGSWLTYYRRHGRRPWVGLQWRDRLRRLLRGTADRTPWLRPDARRALMRSEERTPARAPHPVRPRSVALLTSSLWETVYEGMSPSITGAPCLVTLPLVDPRVIAFVFAIPPVPWGQNKQLLRDAMRGRLPEEVRTRPKTPLSGSMEARIAQWRAAGGANAVLSERVAPWVDRARVEAVYRSGDAFAVVDAWRVLQLDRWLTRMTAADA
jgi:asparagine synthase (glutamine-hydrolysing)